MKQEMKEEVMAMERILKVVIKPMMTRTVRNVRMKKENREKKETCAMMEKWRMVMAIVFYVRLLYRVVLVGVG